MHRLSVSRLHLPVNRLRLKRLETQEQMQGQAAGSKDCGQQKCRRQQAAIDIKPGGAWGESPASSRARPGSASRAAAALQVGPAGPPAAQNHRRPGDHDPGGWPCVLTKPQMSARPLNQPTKSARLCHLDCTDWHRLALPGCVSTRSTHRKCTCHRDIDRPTGAPVKESHLCFSWGAALSKAGAGTRTKTKQINTTLPPPQKSTGFKATKLSWVLNAAQR